MAGRPKTRANRKAGITCGAMTRKGTPCKRRILLRGNKCRNHGGMSLSGEDKRRITFLTGRQFQKTGPKTPEGIARSWAARDAGRASYNAKRRLLALEKRT